MSQVENFCGNVLEVRNQDNQIMLVVGENAYCSYRKDQIEEL